MPEEARHAVSRPSSSAACFVDFDNVLIELGKKLKGLPGNADVGDTVIQVLRKLKDRVESVDGCKILMGRAYGTWEGGSSVPNSLALMSFQPVIVFAHPRKNTADLELSLDALNVMLSREDIHHFIIVGGDRDYIPVVRRILEYGRAVTVASMESGMSGDLRAVVGASAFVPLEPLALETLGLTEFPPVPEYQEILDPTRTEQSDKAQVVSSISGKTWKLQIELDEKESQAFDLIVKALAERKDWEMPIVTFYRQYMNDEFPTLADAERKALVGSLEKKGLIELDIKEGPYGGFTSSDGMHYLALRVNPERVLIKDRIAKVFPGIVEKSSLLG